MEMHPTIWRTCRVLAGATRIRLLKQILQTPDLTVSDLAASAGIRLSRASQELRRLHSRGLVQAIRKGRMVRYRPVPDPQVPEAKPLLHAVLTSLRLSGGQADNKCLQIASAFTHPRRVAIVKELLHGPRSLTALTEIFGSHSRTIQRHLRKLRSHQFVVRQNRKYHLTIGTHPLARCLVHLINQRPG